MIFAERYITKFWDKVDKTDRCWEWTAALTNGYGQYGYALGKWNYKLIQAHRFSWILHFGSIPKGQQVLHHCDNQKCIHPDHLFLGNHRANSDDKVAKRRHNWGENHPLSRLKTQQVIAIFKSALAPSVLAETYGIGAAHVWQIKTGRRWKLVTNPLKDEADEKMRGAK